MGVFAAWVGVLAAVAGATGVLAGGGVGRLPGSQPQAATVATRKANRRARERFISEMITRAAPVEKKKGPPGLHESVGMIGLEPMTFRM